MSAPALRQRSNGAQLKAELIAKAELKEQEEERQTLAEGKLFVPPNFTVKQLLGAIPAHCYQRSAIRSSMYIVQDFIVIGTCAYLSFKVDPFVSSFNPSRPAYLAARAVLHTIISITMGIFATGLWIIAHECGHQAFSASKQINNAVGWVLHSILLVPYHSWRISHARHHAATGHMTRDEVFVPRSRSERGYPEIKEEGELDGMNVSEQRQEELREAISDAPLFLLGHLIAQQLLGWPGYLAVNASGQLHYPPGTNHFKPSSIIFRPDHWAQVIWSDIGLFLVLSALGTWTYFRGFQEVFVLYVIPWLAVNHWLVSITYLQHTDPLLPHYSAAKWTFARGALCTIDRQFFGPTGWIALHGICETHVAHHISSKIPHYHAWEATEAIKNYVGEYYMKSDENFLVSLWKSYRECRFVEDKGDVLFFKNSRGIAQRVAAPEPADQSDSGIDVAGDKEFEEKY